MMEENTHPAERQRWRLPLILAAVVLAIVAAAFYFPVGRPGGSAGQRALPFGPVEQAYAAKLEFGPFGISRAENYLHQEVTTFSVPVRNAGDRTLREVEVTLEFHDAVNQIVLRETRRILGSSVPPLAAGEIRTFEISFEHLPDLWNRQAPSVRVTGLRFS